LLLLTDRRHQQFECLDMYILSSIRDNTHSCKYIEFNCVRSKYTGLSGIMYNVMCY